MFLFWLIAILSDEHKKDPIFRNHVKVCGEAGDFFIWDSRTFHCNTTPRSQNIRACVYICQLPKEKVPAEAKKREIAWMERRCSCHHPGDGFEAFPAVPRYGDPVIKETAMMVSIGDDELTELQKSLLYAD